MRKHTHLTYAMGTINWAEALKLERVLVVCGLTRAMSLSQETKLPVVRPGQAWPSDQSAVVPVSRLGQVTNGRLGPRHIVVFEEAVQTSSYRVSKIIQQLKGSDTHTIVLNSQRRPATEKLLWNLGRLLDLVPVVREALSYAVLLGTPPRQFYAQRTLEDQVWPKVAKAMRELDPPPAALTNATYHPEGDPPCGA